MCPCTVSSRTTRPSAARPATASAKFHPLSSRGRPAIAPTHSTPRTGKACTNTYWGKERTREAGRRGGRTAASWRNGKKPEQITEEKSRAAREGAPAGPAGPKWRESSQSSGEAQPFTAATKWPDELDIQSDLKGTERTPSAMLTRASLCRTLFGSIQLRPGHWKRSERRIGWGRSAS